ncbi:MAG: hypothetical protein AAGA65_28645 [Actinomycetota bacterium]
MAITGDNTKPAFQGYFPMVKPDFQKSDGLGLGEKVTSITGLACRNSTNLLNAMRLKLTAAVAHHTNVPRSGWFVVAALLLLGACSKALSVEDPVSQPPGAEETEQGDSEPPASTSPAEGDTPVDSDTSAVPTLDQETTTTATAVPSTDTAADPAPEPPVLEDYPIDWLNAIVFASTTNQPEVLAEVTQFEDVLDGLRQLATQPLELVGSCEFDLLMSVCFLERADGTLWEVFYIVGSAGEGIGSLTQVETPGDDASGGDATTTTVTTTPPASPEQLARRLIEAANNGDRTAADAAAPGIPAADLDRLLANAPYTFDGCSAGQTDECYAYNDQMDVIVGIESTIIYVGFNT